MKNIVYFIVLFTNFLIFSQEQKTIKTTNFSEIKVFDAITVNLIQSDVNKVVIYGEDRDKVAIVNNNGRLKVRMQFEKLHRGKHTHVDVFYSKILSLIDANEGAFISSSEVIKQTHVDLRAQEGGEIDLEVELEKLDIRAVTGGKIEVKGSAVNQEVSISTGGEYNAVELNNEQAKVNITTGGFAHVNTTEYIEAKVKMGGTIRIYGKTKVIDKTIFLGGFIIQM